MCPCDRLNGYVCGAHCTAPDICQPRDHVDLCLGLLAAPRGSLQVLWRMGVDVTPELAGMVGQIERTLR